MVFGSLVRRRPAGLVAWLTVAVAATAPPPAEAEELARADVVVVVDTSTSMRRPGMDPERSSLLVSKLLADIVPGELAVVRLLDLVDDADLLPSRETGETKPCAEDPSQRCGVVEPASDWAADARKKTLGALARPRRGDEEYKSRLEGHLRQEGGNSMFGLAFRAAQGSFDDHGEGEIPKVVIWLSDGRTDHEPLVRQAVAELRRDGVVVEAIVFGRGDTRLARDLGLEPRRASSPAELMAAFADAFRTIVQAPYRIDGTVAGKPSFEIEPNVDEAWVVVYGDDTLESARLEGPAGTVDADYAADRWPGAGAYRVAYLRRPAAGRWTVHAHRGGPGVAYAVVQRSDLRPFLLAPEEAISGAETKLVAGVRAGLVGELLTDPQVLADATLTATFQDASRPLRDDGEGGDETAGDGRYTARVIFRGTGPVEVTVHLESPLVDRTATATVEVSGTFRYTGGPVTVELGALEAGASSCRPLPVPAERQGEVPLELRALRPPPRGHTLSVRLPAGELEPGSAPRLSAAEDVAELCLRTARRAPDSTADGERWLELGLAGSDDPSEAVPIALRWRVESLSFWELWGRWILTLLAVLVVGFVAGGYLWPNRFQRALALAFAPDADELDEQSPQPVAQWRGVGIGFYRHARAFLHPDFRLSGKPRGALASLHAEKHATRVEPGRGAAISRQTLDGEWEAVSPEGRRARPGDVYRVGEQGPYFRIATQGRRR